LVLVFVFKVSLGGDFLKKFLQVAGLVPGAYLGRGRGNAFLNDLLDSDVLMHIVDASGTTDQGGNVVSEGEESPLAEIRWLVV
jgi:ribosome-binding ATPase YchF (GTP1/OBG family)